MKSIIRRIVSFAFILSFALFLTSCGKKYSLSFNTNGGNEISSVTIDNKTEYTLPIPTRDGFEFIGWYLSSDFSGDSITSITISSNTTVYAKWDELFEITLNLDGGTLDKTFIYGKSGDNVYDLVKDLVPTKSGVVFGAWFNGTVELSQNTKLTKSMTLTAKYKVEYTVNLYKESLTHDGYEKEEAKGYEYAGKTVSYSLDEDGLIEVEKDDSVSEIVIKEDKTQNIITVYYDRELFTITLRSNYPNSSMAEETKTIQIYYGEEKELPDVDFSCEGYYLLGYALSNTSELLYNAHFIDNLPVNEETEEATKDKISANRSMSLYAVWNKGYKDMFGGSDYVFVTPDNETAYLCREGVYFIGEYFDTDKSFIFYNDKENLEGMIYSDGTYAYYNASRDEYSAVLYTVGSGLDSNIKVLFDPYNGITYYDGNEEPDLRESKGTYTIDENNFYHITFTEGPKAGETMIIITGKVTADYVTTEAFQFRKQNEYEMGELVRFVVNNNELTHYLNAYQINLSGFGTLTYNNGSSVETYYYSYDEENKILTINGSDGSNFGKVKIMTVDGVNGYMFYDEAIAQTYNNDNGTTLVLDGVCEATYTTETTSVNGYYTIKQSAFGGYIVTFKNNGVEYTFLTSSKTEDKIVEGDSGESTTESVTSYFFTQKPNGYSEYYYKNETSIYYAPLVVINDTEEGKANVYGYTSNKTYELVLEGTYTYDSNTGLYVFTTTLVHDKKVLTNPQDIKKITNFVFATDTTSTSYSINYWHSSTTTGGETTDYKKEYTGANNSSLVLINGIAILSKDGYVLTGTYTTRSGVTQISGQYGVSYVEIDEDTYTFIALEHAPYNSYVVGRDGMYSANTYVTFDGKGNAKYVYHVEEEGNMVEKFYEGTVTDTNEKTKNGDEIYRFTSTDKTFTFLQDETKYYLFPYIDEYTGTYSSDYGILYLDGYLRYASFTNTDGDEFTNFYIIEGDNVITIQIDGVNRYFDISSRSFSLRGKEYGTYTIVDNQGATSKYLELDGYGSAKVFKYDTDGETKVYIDTNASYTNTNDKFTVSYTESTTDYSLYGYLGSYVSNNKKVNSFLTEHTEFVQTLINSRDWSVLKLDEKGHAVRVDSKGNKDEGSFTIITDTLLYYENNDGSFANIYKYDSAKGTLVESRFVPRGYYTEDLKSLLFSQYGFAVFNFETRYYYNVTSEGVMIYHLDKEDPSANKYGYVEENFGSFDDTKVYKGNTYYQNDGFAITFTRAEDTKDDYPVLVIRNPETRAPLENLIFSPTGNDTFTSSGTVTVGPMTLNCNVVREYVDDHYEMYVLVGYYRFDITVKYSGKAEDGSSTSTYEVTGMHMNRKFDSYVYLNNYYMYYYFYGPSFVSTYENNLGVISQVQTFDKEGKLTEDYMKVEFGEETKALDLNGSLINIDNVSYEYDEQSNSYTLEYLASDGYTYKLYILIRNHQAFNTNAYIIYAVTRKETITTLDYELTIERIITSDYNFPVGGVYNATLKQGDTEFNSTESFEIDGILHYVARTYDDNEHITSTTYYKLELTYKDSESLAEDTVVPYESVVITPLDATTYYTSDKKIFVDVLDSKIVFISIEGSKYLISECTFDSETNTYTIITSSLAEYKITINTDNTITATEMIDESTEEETEE